MGKWKIYSIPNCPYCDKAKDLLRAHKMVITEQALDVMQGARAKDIMDKAGMNTVPIIYLNDQLIGGYDDLVEYFKGSTI